MKTLGLLLVTCGVLVYVGLAASFIKASGYWPWMYTPPERRRRAQNVVAAVPVWVGAAWVCVICGAFVISDSNWVGIAIIGCCGLSQVAFVTWSQRQARRRSARRHVRS